MDEVTRILLDIATASSLEQAATLSLALFARLFSASAGCITLWDSELNRHIVAATWADPASAINGGALRRQALALVNTARQTEIHRSDQAVHLEPLSEDGQYVGAVALFGAACVGPSDALAQLRRVSAHALVAQSRLGRAARVQSDLVSERERLQHLLVAVEQQQRTIDELLAAERQWSTSLEARVEERTTALRDAQSRLIQSEKLAVVGQLASSLAHELNNPLQAIQSGLGLVISEMSANKPEHVMQDLHVIQSELDRIDTIFRQMLDFYRPVTFESRPLDLNAICEGVRILMRKKLQEASITLRLQLGAPLPLTCGDSNQIKQVLLNLVLNAAEAMPTTGGVITLQTIHNGQQVCLCVIDTGVGITPEQRSRLFEPLFTTKTRGLGLGLAISQEIIRRHDGYIAVQSAPGSGTTFEIVLPARKQCHEQS